MIKCSNEVKNYGDQIEAVAQKYLKDFIMGKGDYWWDLGVEMEKAGLGRNDDIAESRIMQRLDEMLESRCGSQVDDELS